jgi:DHA1 family bicyclomycin/chloramphenicol resistance-like MFS transporter
LNPNAARLWNAPRWALALLLACLGMLGPFSIDTCLPAFSGIAAGVLSPLVMHSALLLAPASMALMSVGLAAWVAPAGRRLAPPR